MSDALQTQNEQRVGQTYPSWIGVLLSFFFPGIVPFVSGKKLIGISWFASILILKISGFFCLASPWVVGELPGFFLLTVAVGLWLSALIKAYKPITRLRLSGWIYLLIFYVLFSGMILPGLKVFFQPFKMPSHGMEPTLWGNRKQKDGTTTYGDHFFVETFAYWNREPQRGDVVIFNKDGLASSPMDNEVFVKRVVGVPGDDLSIRDGHLFNHGQILAKPPILAKLNYGFAYGNPSYLTNNGATYQVPDGCYFVIGDNTLNSLDSRYFGPVSAKNILGKVSKIYWPLNRAGIIP